MKKTITVEIDEEMLNGLNNAVAAYRDICRSLLLGCDVPLQFDGLKEKSDKEIRARFMAIKSLYEKIEREFDVKEE